MDRLLEMKSPWGKTMVEIEIAQYQNGSMYIGLINASEEVKRPYGDMTKNFAEGAPNYCAFIDTNNMPGVEAFIEENGLGSSTGFTRRSGFCEYPLYVFDAERLRELCPEGMRKYEEDIGAIKKQEERTKTR